MFTVVQKQILLDKLSIVLDNIPCSPDTMGTTNMVSECLDISAHFAAHGTLDRLWIMDYGIVEFGNGLVGEHFLA